jgi:hypothetical protein
MGDYINRWKRTEKELSHKMGGGGGGEKIRYKKRKYGTIYQAARQKMRRRKTPKN